MIAIDAQATHGYGYLENFLAKRRARKADRLIPEQLRMGQILDVGCGVTPYFLLQTPFAAKYGVDQATEKETVLPARDGKQIHIFPFHFSAGLPLPFKSNFFDVVTMLAVFEHVEPLHLPFLLNEIHRVLKPGGSYVLTTPNAWTDPLLKGMAKIGLISALELSGHKDVYTHGKIKGILQQTRFEGAPLSYGFFEMRMNLWMHIKKT